MHGKKSDAPSMPQLSVAKKQALLDSAKAALKSAYAPYSRFRVGAAVLTEAGAIYSGCNVENASYGLTNCAERTAIFTAVAAEGSEMRLVAVAIRSDPERPCAPCGACRQVIFEFGPNAIVLFQGQKEMRQLRASELLPSGFAF